MLAFGQGGDDLLHDTLGMPINFKVFARSRIEQEDPSFHMASFHACR
jgi:hypothetical protein